MTGGLGGTEELARPTQRVTHLRWALLVLWIAALVGASSTFARQASIEELYAAVSAGDVDSVTIIERRLDGTTGPGVEEVRWREGWVPRVATVFTLRTEREPAGSGFQVTSQDVATVLARRGSAVDITKVDRTEGWSAAWPISRWLPVLAVVLWAMSWGLLITGPEPWRATRWAWFWLLTPPLGPLLFLALSGLTPGLPTPKRVSRRLTGGWAFLIGAIIGGGPSAWYLF